MMASAQVTAAIAKEMVTAGPAKFAAALAPTEKIPAPTATATPMIMRSHVLSVRFSLRPGSSASDMDCSMDLVRKRFIRKVRNLDNWGGNRPIHLRVHPLDGPICPT